MDYRRYYRNGGCYFFTVVSRCRRPILTNPDIRAALRSSIHTVRARYPFTINAWVLLPDHLHTIWTLPENDSGFSVRWNQIKRRVSYECGARYPLTARSQQQNPIWQPRFWEHHIRDETDFAKHFDYLHYNPVKHGYTQSLQDWPYSTFHRYAAQGIYPHDWGGNGADTAHLQNFNVGYDD